MSDPKAIAKDLGTKTVTIVGTKNGPGSDPVVIYQNSFKGKEYFHIRSVWFSDKDQSWCPGKGLTIDPANAKAVLTALGQVGAGL